jgi:hypothetical protein
MCLFGPDIVIKVNINFHQQSVWRHIYFNWILLGWWQLIPVLLFVDQFVRSGLQYRTRSTYHKPKQQIYTPFLKGFHTSNKAKGNLAKRSNSYFHLWGSLIALTSLAKSRYLMFHAPSNANSTGPPSIKMTNHTMLLPLIRLLWLVSLWKGADCFAVNGLFTARGRTPAATIAGRMVSPAASDAEDYGGDVSGEGADLAAQLFKMAQAKGIRLERDEFMLDEDDEEEDNEDNEEEDDDDDDEEEEPEANYPQGAINAFLGYDVGVGAGDKLAGNVTLTNSQLYSEVKERVLDTAGGFVDYVKGARDEEEEEDDDDDDEEEVSSNNKPYRPPETIPDSELTAGEVIMVVLDALRHNDVPTGNAGVEIFFGFSSAHSQVKNEAGLTPDEYATFLQESEYKVLFTHTSATIDKGDYSFDGKRAFFTARLSEPGQGRPIDATSVNFILSTTGKDENACWLIDSMLIRPQSMRRRRRR